MRAGMNPAGAWATLNTTEAAVEVTTNDSDQRVSSPTIEQRSAEIENTMIDPSTMTGNNHAWSGFSAPDSEAKCHNASNDKIKEANPSSATSATVSAEIKRTERDILSTEGDKVGAISGEVEGTIAKKNIQEIFRQFPDSEPFGLL